VLLHITPNEPWTHLALMAVLCMAFRYLATAHYGIAVAALTGTVVILLSLGGVSSSAAVMDRVINSIDRMRTEPATPPELLALARALFANGNRLARTAMTLEALIDDLSTLPAQTEINGFVDETARALQIVATALREKMAIEALPDLRTRQRLLVTLMQGAENPAAAELLARISDRLVDNVDTVAYVVGRSQLQLAGIPALQR